MTLESDQQGSTEQVSDQYKGCMGNEILDMIMGPAVYDSRIRPAGINGTGE
jgi:hypothetical protein